MSSEKNKESIPILMADDDEDDRMMIKESNASGIPSR